MLKVFLVPRRRRHITTLEFFEALQRALDSTDAAVSWDISATQTVSLAIPGGADPALAASALTNLTCILYSECAIIIVSSSYVQSSSPSVLTIDEGSEGTSVIIYIALFAALACACVLALILRKLHLRSRLHTKKQDVVSEPGQFADIGSSSKGEKMTLHLDLGEGKGLPQIKGPSLETKQLDHPGALQSIKPGDATGEPVEGPPPPPLSPRPPPPMLPPRLSPKPFEVEISDLVTLATRITSPTGLWVAETRWLEPALSAQPADDRQHSVSHPSLTDNTGIAIDVRDSARHAGVNGPYGSAARIRALHQHGESQGEELTTPLPSPPASPPSFDGIRHSSLRGATYTTCTLICVAVLTAMHTSVSWPISSHRLLQTSDSVLELRYAINNNPSDPVPLVASEGIAEVCDAGNLTSYTNLTISNCSSCRCSLRQPTSMQMSFLFQHPLLSPTSLRSFACTVRMMQLQLHSRFQLQSPYNSTFCGTASSQS